MIHNGEAYIHLLAATSSSDYFVGIVAVIVGFVLTTMQLLIARIFNGLQKEMEKANKRLEDDQDEMKEEIKQMIQDLRNEMRENRKHVEGILASTMALAWRTGSIEDFLEDPKYGFKPPRQFPQQI